MNSVVQDGLLYSIQSGGIGVSITNDGYAQIVSLFTICTDVGVFRGTGGQCDITNSNSSFGNFGLVSDGVSTNYTAGITASATAGSLVSRLLELELHVLMMSRQFILMNYILNLNQ